MSSTGLMFAAGVICLGVGTGLNAGPGTGFAVSGFVLVLGALAKGCVESE